MAVSNVKTIWFTELEAARKAGGIYTPTPYSTLNEKFQIQQTATLNTGEMPDTDFLCIGRGGHRNVGPDLTDILQHRITNACLFEHLPFVAREVDNDLSAAEREKYRLRRLENYDGVDYFFYYAKKLTPTAGGGSIVEIDDSVTPADTRAYVPSSAQLSPEPVTMVNGVVNSSTDVFLQVAGEKEVTIDNAEVAEIINACRIKYNDERKAVISELAVVSGFDREISVADGGVAATYDELVAAQCCVFMPGDNKQLIYQTEEIVYGLSVGNTLPYLT
jgi:hypothetical protein